MTDTTMLIAGAQADARHWKKRAEAAEARCARLEKDGTALADRAQAFLKYFNPAIDLSSAKEDQWWSVFDAVNDWRAALSDTAQEMKPLPTDFPPPSDALKPR